MSEPTRPQLKIWSLFPELLNIHGDAANAEALAQRARWRGLDATVVPIALGQEPPAADPDAIIIGSGFDADASDVAAGLKELAPRINTAIGRYAPLLAIGLGWELCSVSTETSEGTIAGLGLFPGTHQRSKRTTGDVLIESQWGRLIGYEYHLRDYQPVLGETALGSLSFGVGHALGAKSEGSVVGSAIGTGLHGPILARNGALTDHLVYLLSDLLGLRLSDPTSDVATVDRWNDQIMSRTCRELGVR